MANSLSSHSTGGFNVQDIFFVLFKHKWKILLWSILGLGIAAGVFYAQTPLYQSQAKLLVRYVLERPAGDPTLIQTNPGGGNDVINTEIEILTSVDLAKTVAERVGVDRLVPEAGGSAEVADAAGKILAELEVAVGQSNNILHVSYGNSDPQLAKEVLRQLIDRYFERHLIIHRSGVAFDEVAKQTEEVRARLHETEQQLQQLRTNSGIVSLADATSALSAQRARTQEELIKARADLAELQASMGSEVNDPIAADPATAGGVRRTSGRDGKPAVAPPPQAVSEYRAVMEVLAFLQKRDLELRIKFKPGNRLLVLNQQQLATYDARRRNLLANYPDLTLEAAVTDKEALDPRANPVAGKARLAAISAKIEVFETHLKEINQQFGQQYAVGASIEELERRKQLEDAEYRSLEANLKNAKLDQTLNPSSMPNITVVQQPTEPIKTYDSKMKKLILGLAGSGLAVGVGLAFFIELLLARKVTRPIDIQARLQLPLLLSIPYIRKRERGGLMLSNSQDCPRLGAGDPTDPPCAELEEVGLLQPPRKADHFILPFSETIRDRIIFNFEVNHVIHRPKLVAVTGLSAGAGASTIAAGLAKSFAEIRGTKVLLVDLSSYHPEQSPLFGEVPRHSLHGALQLARQSQFRDHPQSLYYASAIARRDAHEVTTFSPVHLYELMPQLQASQYDYIIFDMPSLHPTSRTLTMAGMMDKVLLVLDAENTDRDSLVWGYSELVQGKADVSCVFNKTRSHAPDWLVGRN